MGTKDRAKERLIDALQAAHDNQVIKDGNDGISESKWKDAPRAMVLKAAMQAIADAGVGKQGLILHSEIARLADKLTAKEVAVAVLMEENAKLREKANQDRLSLAGHDHTIELLTRKVVGGWQMNITSLSPSMVNKYRQCPRQFYYDYCLGLPRMGSAYTAYGSAFHAMAEENYFQKVRTAKDLPVDLLLDFFRDDLHYRDDVDWKEQDQTLDQTKDQGVVTVKAYQESVAPGIQPQVVEHEWSMEVNNRPWVISGKIDLVTDDDLVIDLKTTGRRLKKPKAEHAFQLSTYAMAWKAQTRQHNVSGRLDYAIRGKAETISLDVVTMDAQSIVSTFDNVATCIQKEWWPVFRSHFLCSRKYCSFWTTCQDDCGGTVAT